MFKSFVSPYLRVTLILLVLATVSAVGAVLVGIDDNPPGLVLGVLAGSILVAAFVHHWRAPKRFLVHCAISLGIVVVFVAVSIAIDLALTGGVFPEPVAVAVESGGNALALLLAFLAVPSVLVGLVGALVVWLAGRRKQVGG